MSWAEEDWTVGLSGKVLQKVKELQVHHERLSRENKQKQLLLDNIHASLEKQTAKYEEVRVELQSSHRELQRVQEEAQAAVTSKERLSQDLQSKQAQVCSLEGQLDAARTLNNKLTQEVKRLEAELEKLQNSSRATEATLFSTPCWSDSSPWEHSGSKKEEHHGNREEGKTQGLHVRRLQFPDMPSSSLLRQQPRGARHVRTPEVYSTPSAAFPWERDDTAAKRPSPETPYSDALSQSLAKDLSVTTNSPNDSETHSASELRSRLADLEEELRVKAQTINTVQNEVAQNKKQLTAKELNLQKLRDELSLAHTRMAQEGERASTAEQRSKQLQEELKCQRQNAESSRVQHQQRTKELEKQHQRDLQEFQKERQYMERQHQQEINKLNQELAQARALHNALQAQLDKVLLQKQAVEKEVDTLKEKLKWTEGQLQQSEKKGSQTQAKLTEALREAEALTVSLKQSQKKEKALEEDGRRLTEERDHAQCLLRQLQEQKAAMAPLQQTLPVCSPAQTSSQTPFTHSSQPQPRKPNNINAVKQKREEMDRRVEIIAPYPTDREPGEGIDSEHISDNLPINSEESRLQSKRAEVLDTDCSQTIAETVAPHRSKQASEDLQAENVALRSELRDVREELQKRLDDLEGQRRAETEARTRLKQLSRKNANQVNEKEEQYNECKAQLEKERVEVDRLKKAVAALETEIMRERQDKAERKDGEERNNAAQDKEDEMIELNMQLKKQLSEVKAQLVLEQEERTQFEEEMRKKQFSDIDFKTKIAELEAKIEQLKVSPRKVSEAEEELSAANSPVTYLTLREDEGNSNIVNASEQPETLAFCESINERNTMKSLESGRWIQPEETALINPPHSPITFTDVAQEYPNQEQNRNKSSEVQEVCNLSVLATQVQSLQKQNMMEKERANQSQIKLELLQNKVTQQTQQLTMAFEKQSQHISGLLTELQEKENTILNTEQELQQCKQQLRTLKGEMETEGRERGANGQNHDEEKSSSVIERIVTDNNNRTAGTVQLIPDAESPPLHGSQQIINNSDSALQEIKVSDSVESCEMSTELLKLKRENLVLKLKIAALTEPEACGLNTDGGDLFLKEQKRTALSVTGVQACSDTQQNSVESIEHGEEREEQPEAGSQRLDQISHLQQQVVALQTKLQVLFEENRQKTQELALWKLSSESVTEAESQHTAQVGGGCVTLMREDEILLSCSSNKLQGRTLFSRLQFNATSESKISPFSILQDHNEDNAESDKENASPAQLNQRKDIRDVVDSSSAARTEVKAMRSSINRAVAVDLKSVSTQTESLPVLPGHCTHTETEGEEEEADSPSDSPSESPVPFGERPQSKEMGMVTASFPIPSDPASLAERIRRSRTQLSAAFDDTEYEPYGLPEVVMKGFADIPTGPSCPYIVRRGLLGTAALPVPQKNSGDPEETD